MRLVILFVVMLLTRPVFAQTAASGVYDMKDREFTADEVKRALAPPSTAPVAGSQDGGTAGTPGAKPRKVRGLSVEPAGPRKLSMQLQFGFDSAEIAEGARSRLDALGIALQSPELSSETYIVSGHTDSSGRYNYNVVLSKRRAEAVKAYLVTNYHIDPNKIIPIGKGPDELLDPSEPNSAANRRVQFEATN